MRSVRGKRKSALVDREGELGNGRNASNFLSGTSGRKAKMESRGMDRFW